METSQIILNHGLTFLAVSTGFIVLLVGGFLIKFLVDLSKLTKNMDETASIVKSEIEPTLSELNNTLKSINSIAKNADKQVDSISKLFENVFGLSSTVFLKAKNLSGGLIKGFVKGFVSLARICLKK